MASISYPTQWLLRPEDRRLMALLESMLIPRWRAEHLLYRLWADFHTAGRGTRPSGPENEQGVPAEWRVIELFCGWEKQPGQLVRACIEAGFIVEGVGDEHGPEITLVGYEEINGRQAVSMQKRGAWAKILKDSMAHARRVTSDAESAFPAERRVPLEVSEDVRRRANHLGVSVARCAAIPQPPLTPDLPRDLLEMCVDIVKKHDELAVRQVLESLVMRRKDPSLVKRLDAILRDWDKLAKDAKKRAA